MTRKIEMTQVWVWNQIADILIGFLIRAGMLRKKWLWNLVYRLSPTLTGWVVFMNEANRVNNEFIWSDDPATPGDDCGVDDLLTEISKFINRSPAPMGEDTYRITVFRMGALPEDRQGLTHGGAHMHLSERKTLGSWEMSGDRWQEWKKGGGKDTLRSVLEKAEPCPEAPITLVKVIFTGQAIARVLSSLDGKPALS